MIENHSTMPAPGAAHPVIFIKSLRHDPDLRGQMRYHRRRHISLVVGKTAVLAPKCKLDSQSKPASAGEARQQRHVSRGKRPIRHQFVRRPLPLHRSPPDRLS